MTGIDNTSLMVVSVFAGAFLIMMFGYLMKGGGGDDVSKLKFGSAAGGAKLDAQWKKAEAAGKEFHLSVEELFKCCDRDDNGTVSKRELKTALKASEFLAHELGLKRIKDVHEFMDKCDADHDGVFTLAEFKGFMAKLEETIDRDAERRAKGIASEEDLKEIQRAFDQIDTDHDGLISAAELAAGYLRLAAARGHKMTEEHAHKMAAKAHRRYDKDSNGTIDSEEFIPMCLRGPFAEIFQLHEN